LKAGGIEVKLRTASAAAVVDRNDVLGWVRVELERLGVAP
jgi:hypothetical protein